MQTKISSMLEQVANVGSGFLLALVMWEYVIRPAIYMGVITIDSSLTITLIFTIVSLVRGYVWRRLFNKLVVRGSND